MDSLAPYHPFFTETDPVHSSYGWTTILRKHPNATLRTFAKMFRDDRFLASMTDGDLAAWLLRALGPYGFVGLGLQRPEASDSARIDFFRAMSRLFATTISPRCVRIESGAATTRTGAEEALLDRASVWWRMTALGGHSPRIARDGFVPTCLRVFELPGKACKIGALDGLAALRLKNPSWGESALAAIAARAGELDADVRAFLWRVAPDFVRH